MKNLLRKMIPDNPESGQTIVMMAFLIIGLIGALGLAIDGGRMYLWRRKTQNATDAAIIAASYAVCTGRDPVLAGQQAAIASQMDPDDNSVTVTISNPPMRAIETEEDIRYYVDVQVTKTLVPYFIQFVYDGELMVSSGGVGFCTPPFDPTGVPAVWAGATTCDTCGDNPSGNSILTWTGSQSEFYSTGDLFFSNGNIFLNGSEAQPSTLEGAIDAHCDVTFSGTQLGDYPVELGVPEIVEPPIPYRIEDFAPGGYFAERAKHDPDYGIYYAITPETVAANPGVAPYSWIQAGKWIPNGWMEGLYYVEYEVSLLPSKAVVGFDTTADANAQWDGVTIAATQQIKMVNPMADMVYYIGGILYYSDFNPGFPIGCNMSETGIEASSESSSTGCIIAPWSGIQFSANDTSVVGALIGQFVWMRGADMYFEYTPDMLDPVPPKVQLAQ